MIKRTIKKFDEYFLYAIEAKGLEVGDPKAQCKLDTECGDEGHTQKCCVSALLVDKKTGKQHENFRCMNKGIVSANMDLTIDDMKVSMRCQESSAMKMGAAIASAATLAAMTLY